MVEWFAEVPAAEWNAGMQLKESPEAGRFLIAGKLLDAGEVLLKCDQPEAVVVHESLLLSICATCFNSVNGSSLAGPLQCCRRVAYCSQRCRNASESVHAAECEVLAQLPSELPPGLDENDMTSLRLAVSVLSQRHRTSSESDPTTKLCSNPAADVGAPCSAEWVRRFSAQEEVLLPPLTAAWGEAPCKAEVRALLSSISANAFSISSAAGAEAGRAVYVAASLFNHSCEPNVARVQSGRSAEFRTTGQVLEGESLCISYVDLRKNLGARRRGGYLIGNYGFHCRCESCADTMD